MDEVVADSDYEAMQHFISGSPWDFRRVINRVAQESDKLLGGTGQTGLLIDETAFAKKGKSSVGVSRQWNGRLGKTENSQVGVFGALCAGDRVIPIDVELYLPKEWTDNSLRCDSAGIPKERQVHKTKPQLAIDIVKRQRELGTRFDFVSADGLYGNSMKFCQSLDDENEIFMLHVHSDRNIYLEDPKPKVPQRTSSRGRKPEKLKAQTEPIRVDHLAKSLSDESFKRMNIRKTTTGVLEVDTYRRQVWVWDGEEENARLWTLYIRREVSDKDDYDYKFCLTNAATDLPTITIARMEAQRFWIERAFEDAKKEAGMAEYQIRGWLAWHHHIALVMMTMLFMTKQRILFKDECPMLSCYDIKVLLAYFLPKKNDSADEMLRQMEVRHARRKTASQNAARRQKLKQEIQSHQRDNPEQIELKVN